MAGPLHRAELQTRWNLADISTRNPVQREALAYCSIMQALDRPSWDALKASYQGSASEHTLQVVRRKARRLYDAVVASGDNAKAVTFAEWVGRAITADSVSLAKYRDVGDFYPNLMVSGELIATVETRFYRYEQIILSESPNRAFRLYFFDEDKGEEEFRRDEAGECAVVEISTSDLDRVSNYFESSFLKCKNILGLDDISENERRSLLRRCKFYALDFLFLKEMGSYCLGHHEFRADRLANGEALSDGENQALCLDTYVFAAGMLRRDLRGGGNDNRLEITTRRDAQEQEELAGWNDRESILSAFSAFALIGLVPEPTFEAMPKTGHLQLSANALQAGALLFAFIRASRSQKGDVDQATRIAFAILQDARLLSSRVNGSAYKVSPLDDAVIEHCARLDQLLSTLKPRDQQ